MTRRPTQVAAGAILMLLAVGCVRNGRPGATPPTGRPDVLTEEDLRFLHDYTTLEAIRQLRQRWLRGRGPSIGVDVQSGALSVERGETEVRVYLDDVPQRDVQALDLIPVPDVIRVRFLNAADATLRFGVDHDRGAILVTTRAG